MQPEEKRALMAICLLAAFADGAKVEREREEIRRIAERYAAQDSALGEAYADVAGQRARLGQLAAALRTSELRELAYEMAVCVCDSDGAQTAAERAFLAQLRAALGLSGTPFEIDHSAAALAVESIAVPRAPHRGQAEIDESILKTSILCAALEQLPQTIASLAIVPLQMRMVHKIAADHGYELDRGRVGELLAVLGIGAASQMIESYARRIVGGLIGGLAGGLGRAIAARATGSAVAFATTYALGHVADRYYAGGRKLSTAELKDEFASMLARARSIEGEHAAAIARQASTVNVADLVPLVRRS
jgi:uncharacterized protein (DUF697 family)/tellurite resistance protein